MDLQAIANTEELDNRLPVRTPASVDATASWFKNDAQSCFDLIQGCAQRWQPRLRSGRELWLVFW